MARIFKKKIENAAKNRRKFKVMGFDGREDFTLTERNQFIKEEHITFVNKGGLILESLSFESFLQRNVPHHYPHIGL